MSANAKKKRKAEPPERQLLESTCRIEAVRPLIDDLDGRVIGQDEAVDALSCSFSRLLSGLRDRSRPLLSALLLGPTGVGKTETAKSLAQTLFGSERAMTRVNCEEYAHGHEISKLLGSPPGYVGANVEPLLSQARIDEPHGRLREALMLKPDWNPGLAERIASDKVGSSEMGELLEGRPAIGFGTEAEAHEGTVATVRDVALRAAGRMFPFEFLNRFDEMLVYSALEREHLWQIFDKFLAAIHERALLQAGVPLLIHVSDDAKSRIIDKGTDLRFGARPLRRAIEREIVDPLSRFIASHQLTPGDVVEVELDAESGQVAFYRAKRSIEGLVAV